MATCNGGRFLRQSIDSVLQQTYADFEFIITDDASGDATADILAGIDDKRVRRLRNTENLGVVATRNRCFAEARGTYIAMLDHDDLSRPTRLQRQVEYLDRHEQTVLVGTAAHIFDGESLRPTRHPTQTSPMLLRWLLHVANPLVCSSIMVRADAIRTLGAFMREAYRYADDFDLYHRLIPLGEIARLDEKLTIYRMHEGNTFRRYEETMAANAVKVLVPAYTPWFGEGAAAAATLVVQHLAMFRPVNDSHTLRALHVTFQTLRRNFLQHPAISDADRAAILRDSEALWQRVRTAAMRGGWPLQRVARRTLKRWQATPPRRAPAAIGLYDTEHMPAVIDPHLPPTMFVVIDTEAEFDWTQPFSRNLRGVTAMREVERGQAVFDGFGLRPIYVVDFPVASQDSSIARLRAMLDRGACRIGAHLHPWTTPPFEEQISSRNSFPGNLAPDLEEQKLVRLLQTIEAGFGIRPVFYKSGRYGIGRMTAPILARHGIKVDFSVLAGADLRHSGGPDFRDAEPIPYWVGGHGLLTVPMTRAHVGLAARLGRFSETMRHLPALHRLRLPSVLSRMNLIETITLTPEGVTTAEQIRLLKVMLRRGHRIFVLHYHSPSLSPGHTPYVRSREDVAVFVNRLRDVCRFFFEQVGGMPGHPDALLEIAAHPGHTAKD